MVLGISTTFECLRSRSWPSVDATIMASTVEEIGYDPASYSPRIEYHYTIDGQSYVGRKISVGWEITFPWLWLAERTSRDYVTGSIVSAYYSSENPVVAVLKPGMHTGPLVAFVIALFTALIAWKQFLLGIIGPP
jgi:hypothetical protein